MWKKWNCIFRFKQIGIYACHLTEYAPNVIYHWNINYDMNTFSNFYYLYRWINIDVFVNKDLRLKVSWGNKQTKVKMHVHRTLIDRDRKSGITKPRHEFIKNIEKFERPWIPWFVSNWYVVWKSLYMLVRKKFRASVKDFILLHTWQSIDLFAKIVTVNHSHYLRK